MKKVLLFQHTKSRYNVLASMTESLQKAFLRQGIRAELFDDWSGGLDGSLEYIREGKFDKTISINIVVPDSFIYEGLGVEHIYLSVDSFANNPKEISLMQHGKVLFVDEYSKEVFSERNRRPSYWCPHAISNESIQDAKKRLFLPIQDRVFDVVLLGSFVDYEAEFESWKEILRPIDIEFFLHIAEKTLSETVVSFQAEAFQYIENIPKIGEKLLKKGLFASDLVASLERYIRGVDKKNVFKALQGRSIHVFSGDSEECWKKYASNCICHPPVAFFDIGEVLSQAKIVINSSPSIRKGFHERLFMGLCYGATVVTSKIDLLPTWLEEKGALVSYKAGTESTIEERLSCAHRKEELMGEIWFWLCREHTWDVRVRDVFSIFLK